MNQIIVFRGSGNSAALVCGPDEEREEETEDSEKTGASERRARENSAGSHSSSAP